MTTLCSGMCVWAQGNVDAAKRSSTANNSKKKKKQQKKAPTETVGKSTKLFFGGVARDQLGVWTSPLHIEPHDLDWLLPLGAITGAAIATDSRVMQHTPSSVKFTKRSTEISNVGVGALIGAGAILFFDGHLTKNEHASETGRLAAEAAVDGMIFNTIVQEVTRRQRPFAAPNPGDFFVGGGRAFPSDHAVLSWSIATVIADEYPGKLTKLLAYGTALGVSAARVTGRDHSPSDVIVGGIAGTLIGSYVYHSHHDERLGGVEALPAADDKSTSSVQTVRSPGATGSAYVALDSPIYEQLDRLAMLGYIHSQFLGLRPWTRMECARLVQEAGDKNVIAEGGEAAELYATLSDVFAYELKILKGQDAKPTAAVDRVYSRIVGIAGPPVNDSFHFGQTIYNDFGRPYQKGFNNQTGVEASASAGRFEISVRGEYQNAAVPGLYSPAVQQTLANMDHVPDAYFQSPGSTNRLELLDTYAGITLKNWQLSIGKQSLWEGVDSASALIISDNIDPLYMFRVNRVSPLVLPWVLHWLGPVRTEFFLGATEGHHYPGRPWVQGLKVSLKPTPNFEFGVSRTVLFAGDGRPLTPRSFWNAFSSVGDNTSTIPGTQFDVGDRRGEFDFHYRLPYLRNWVAIYGDFMTDDDPSPLSAPQRSILAPGIELVKVPKLPRLQLRVEGLSSNAATTTAYNGTFFYWNGAYPDGYANRGNIIGSWIGRDSTAVWGEAKYWISSTHTVTLTARGVELAHNFIPGGGRTNDVSIADSLRIRHDWQISGQVQFERWNIPTLATAPQRNLTTFLELRYTPHEQ
ncbi:MAG TPA: capsule assembly Wzi family protein [Candidatus Koribacter sp.]|jgi:hypothetical protein